MNFLPLADRELRITARKARTYCLRSAIALGTMAMGTVFIVLGFSRIISPSSAGKAFFESMSVALYVGVTLDTLTAAGSLGRERRENTLGFLFLTPLKGYDVVAGKLAGVLVHQFYALLATLPVMSISFFIGGVSGSDFMRMAIALLNALFFSSTLGLLTGACIQRESRAVGGAVAMSVLFCIGLPIIGFVLKPVSISPIFLVPTPAGALIAALGSGIGVVSLHIFWWSLLVSQLMSWSFFILACRFLPKSIQEKGFVAEKQSAKMQTLSEKKTSIIPSEKEEFYDLFRSRSGRGMTASRKFIMGLCLVALLAVTPIPGGSWWASLAVLAVVMHLVLKFLVTARACGALMQQQQSGELELLLTTPLDVSEILRGHLLSIKRQYCGLVLSVLGLDAFLAVMAWYDTGGWEGSGWALVFGLEVAWLLLNLYVLAWAGLCFGMTCKSLAQAIRRTIIYVLLTPWAGMVASAAIVGLLTSGRGLNDQTAFVAGIWFAILLVVCNLGFLGWSMNELRENFRVLAAHQSIPRSPRKTPVEFGEFRPSLFPSFSSGYTSNGC